MKLYEFGKVVVDELIRRDIGYDPKSKVVEVEDGEGDLGVDLGVGG